MSLAYLVHEALTPISYASPPKATDMSQQALLARSVTLFAMHGEEIEKYMLANTPYKVFTTHAIQGIYHLFDGKRLCVEPPPFCGHVFMQFHLFFIAPAGPL